MRRTVLIAAALAVLGVLVALRALGCLGGTGEPQPRVSAGYVASAPIALVASSSGDTEEQTWWLSVNSAGQAEALLSGNEPLRFQVPQDDWDAFRKAIEQARFFDLDPFYGDVVPDGSTQTLTITAGDATRTVTVHYLMNLPPAERKEADRAARLLAMVRRWIDDAGGGEVAPPERGRSTTAASMPTPAWGMQAPSDPPLATKIVQFDYGAQTGNNVTAADVTADIGEPHRVIESSGEVRHAYFVKRNIDPPDWVYVLVYDKEGRLKRGEYSPRTTYRLDDQRQAFEAATRPSGP